MLRRFFLCRRELRAFALLLQFCFYQGMGQRSKKWIIVASEYVLNGLITPWLWPIPGPALLFWATLIYLLVYPGGLNGLEWLALGQ